MHYPYVRLRKVESACVEDVIIIIHIAVNVIIMILLKEYSVILTTSFDGMNQKI